MCCRSRSTTRCDALPECFALHSLSEPACCAFRCAPRCTTAQTSSEATRQDTRRNASLGPRDLAHRLRHCGHRCLLCDEVRCSDQCR